MPINIDSKEYVVKCGLISIMQELLEKNLVSEDEKPDLQFQIKQHNYNVANWQSSGFGEEAIFNSMQTVAKLFDLEVIDSSYMEYLESTSRA